jgi:hypothetical protein
VGWGRCDCGRVIWEAEMFGWWCSILLIFSIRSDT